LYIQRAASPWRMWKLSSSLHCGEIGEWPTCPNSIQFQEIWTLPSSDVFLTVHHSINLFLLSTWCTIPLFCNRPYMYYIKYLTESDNTWCRKIQFWPPEDEHRIARNMPRYLMWYIYYRMRELCIKLVIKTSFYSHHHWYMYMGP
jgi:hypothetical protein